MIAVIYYTTHLVSPTDSNMTPGIHMINCETLYKVLLASIKLKLNVSVQKTIVTLGSVTC